MLIPALDFSFILHESLVYTKKTVARMKRMLRILTNQQQHSHLLFILLLRPAIRDSPAGPQLNGAEEISFGLGDDLRRGALIADARQRRRFSSTPSIDSVSRPFSHPPSSSRGVPPFYQEASRVSTLVTRGRVIHVRMRAPLVGSTERVQRG